MWPIKTKACKRCGKIFRLSPCEEAVKSYCSNECKNGPRIEKVCPGCSRVFLVCPSQSAQYLYCSVPCRSIAQVAKVCERCGQIFKVQPSSASQRFCNKNCQYEQFQKACKVCFKVFPCIPARVSTHQFCGMQCYSQWQSQNRKGPNHHQFTGGQSAACARRRTREKATRVEPVSRKFIIERDGLGCYVCGVLLASEDVHIEHVTPLSRGGAHVAGNLRVSCQPCNFRKGKKLLEEFVCFI